MRILLVLLALCLFTESLAWAQAPSADEIVRRAVARRAEARRTGGPFVATIHTVALVDVRGDSTMVALLPGGEVAHEALGTFARDGDMGTRIRIYAERGDPNPTGLAGNLIGNVQSLGDYFSIDDDQIVLLNTSIASPLAEDAMEHYRFRYVGRSNRGVDVHEIAVEPLSRLFPGFEGRLFITEESYDLAEADLRASDQTAIPFVDELQLIQRFAPVGGGAYQPESMELRGTGEVMAVAFGVADQPFAFAFISTLTNRQANVPIPDSIRAQLRTVVVDDDADRDQPSLWSGPGPEKEVAQERAVSFSALPYIDYNRAGSASLGASLGVAVGPADIGLLGGYSFGLERGIGEASASVTLGETGPLQVTPRVSAFSQIATTTTGDKSYPRIMNTLVAASLHQDYYNFYRKDGWSAGLDVGYAPLRLAVTLEQSRQFSIGNNARWALLTWTSKEFQPNPPIADGSYQTVQADLSWGRAAPFLKITPVDAIDLRWTLSGLSGRERASDVSFRLAEALLSVSVPVVNTGYNPMTLTLLGAGGIGDSTLPPQYQFRLRTSAASFGKPGGFVSPPKALYGGTEYLAVGGEFNLTDLPWRALHLPTYKGRGVELIVAGGSARYRQTHPTGYIGTGDQWYSEAGIALSRIPLFLTDLIAGRVDIRWGLGPLGQFGANFTFVVPL